MKIIFALFRKKRGLKGKTYFLKIFFTIFLSFLGLAENPENPEKGAQKRPLFSGFSRVYNSFSRVRFKKVLTDFRGSRGGAFCPFHL